VEEEERLDELFEELEEISDSALKKKLNKIEKIEPSDTFRVGLWAKIDRVKWWENFWDGLFPKMPWPAYAFAAIALLFVWIGGFRSGLNINKKDEKLFKNPTELSLSEFGSDYPTNSMQSWVVKTTLTPSEE
jgi:hypothetical protein